MFASKRSILSSCFKRNFSSVPLRLHNKVALITGAGSGIGREASILFAKNGCKVMCADLNENTAKETMKMIRDNHGVAEYSKLDVSNSEDVQKVFEKTEKIFDHLNVVFNNAGIMLSDDDNAQTTPEPCWDKTFDVNVKGVWYGCKYAIPALRRAKGGSVINTGSFVALRGAATPQLAYTSSKGAVLAMTRELAIIHAKEKIRFNSLCPGPLRTELLMKFLNTEQKKTKTFGAYTNGTFW